MAGPTDVLTEDVKDLRAANRELADEIKRVFDRLSGEMSNSNQRAADAMRESNQRLADAINRLAGDFGNFRVEVAKELGAINTNLQTLKGEVAKDLGGINTNLETFKGRTETSLSVAKWAAMASFTVLVGLVAWSYSAYERAIHIEDSVVVLRDQAKAQGEALKAQDEALKAQAKAQDDRNKAHDDQVSKILETLRVVTAPKTPPAPIPKQIPGPPIDNAQRPIREPDFNRPPPDQ